MRMGVLMLIGKDCDAVFNRQIGLGARRSLSCGQTRARADAAEVRLRQIYAE